MNRLNIKIWSLIILLIWGFKSSNLSAKSINLEKNISKNYSKYSSEKPFYDVLALSEAFSFNMNGMELDILANDRVNNGDLINLTTNASVTQVGNWPTGIYINNLGKVIVIAGTVMPRIPLEYQIKNTVTQTTQNAKLILYDVSNKISDKDIYVWNEADGFCYTTNINERLFTLHIVNIGALTINTVSANANGEKLRVNATGYSTTDMSWTSPLGFDYYNFLTNATTILPFEEVTFKYRKNSILSDDEIKLPAVRFGVMNGQDITASPGSVVNNFSSIKVYKTPSAPSSRSIDAYIGHNITAQSLSQISNSDVSKYKFYKLNAGNYEVINANTQFPNTALGTYTFYYAEKNSAGCESAKSSLNVTVKATNVTGGIININNVAGANQQIICPEGSVVIRNQTHGDSGNVLAIIYRWEVSENNGANWVSLIDDPAGTDYDYSSAVNGGNLAQLRSHVTLNNIKKSLWLRRKTDQVGGAEYSYSNTIIINVENNILNFPNGVKSFSAALNSSFTLPNVTPSIANSTKSFYDQNGALINTSSVVMSQKGSFNYSVKVVSPLGCITVEQFQINVFDINDCTTKTVKTYAKKSMNWTSGLSNTYFKDDAIDNNNAGYATLTGGVVVLGLGSVGLDLYFVKPNGSLYTPSELVGKKVTLKLGEQYSGLKVAGGLSVIGRTTNQTNPDNITFLNSQNVGKTFGVKGGILDLLKGDNVFTFSFTPKGFNGENVGFNGVRIQLGSLLSVADLATVFYAYIEDDIQSTSGVCNLATNYVSPKLYNLDNSTFSLLYPNSQTDIDGNVSAVLNQNIPLNNFAEDITWGNRTEVLNVASALSSIVHPYYSVDTDYNSFALINSTVGVLNQQFLQVHLKQKAQPGDQIRVVLSYPNINLINLRLLQLGNFKLVYYLGDAIVGEDPLEQFRVLDLGLFNFGNHKRAVLTKPIRVPFDRVEIRQFQTINVNIGDGLHIYDIRVQPQMLFENQDDPKQVTKICAAEPLGVQKPDICTQYVLSFAKILNWGNQLTDENGNPLFEADGTTPIYSVLAVQDIANSTLSFKYQKTNSNGTFTDYFNIPRMYKSDENNGILLLKVQSVRQGCNYGEPEYLKVRLENCNDALGNPTLRVIATKN